MTPRLITIDGPAGAGKTTAAAGLAKRLGYICVDTGALYRGIGYAARKAGVNPADENATAALCENLNLRLLRREATFRLILGGQDITEHLRAPAIADAASKVSAHPAVRRFLLQFQREVGAAKNAVFEGRDMGTVVFPDADIKFFLAASLQVRAERRLRETGNVHTDGRRAMMEEIRKRDHRDQHRKAAPLIPAMDAVRIDSTEKTAEAVVSEMIDYIVKKFPEWKRSSA